MKLISCWRKTTCPTGNRFGLLKGLMKQATPFAGGLLVFMALQLGSTSAARSQQPPPIIPSFASGVDLVRVSAVVRDRKGRLIPHLTKRDFEVVDAGEPQPIVD